MEEKNQKKTKQREKNLISTCIELIRAQRQKMSDITNRCSSGRVHHATSRRFCRTFISGRNVHLVSTFCQPAALMWNFTSTSSKLSNISTPGTNCGSVVVWISVQQQREEHEKVVEKLEMNPGSRRGAVPLNTDTWSLVWIQPLHLLRAVIVSSEPIFPLITCKRSTTEL